jgi:hypothetical protein
MSGHIVSESDSQHPLKLSDDVHPSNHLISQMASKAKTMDLVFLIDATGSMASSLKAAHDKATSLAQLLRDSSPDVDFHFGCICYRDPIDAPSDIHEVLGLSPIVNDLVRFLAGIRANGGGDSPEDWVGAYRLALREISWRDGAKTIVHIADAPAHGQRWGGPGHEEEASKLVPLIQELAKRRIVLTAIDIHNGAGASFRECKKIYDETQGPGFDYQALDPSAVYQSEAMGLEDFELHADGAGWASESECIGMQMCMQTQCACQQALDDRY